MGAITAAGVVEATAQMLLECASEALAGTDAGAPPAAYLVPGAQVAWDHCACEGQLTVHVQTAYPSDNFPDQALRTQGCTTAFTVVHYVVTILRCAPGSDDEMGPPTPAEMTAAALLDFADRAAVRQGVACCLLGLAVEDRRRPGPPWVMQEQLGVGAEGGCVGSELHVLVGHLNCDACGPVG